MTGFDIRLLGKEDAAAAALLHEASFSNGEHWSAFAFRDMLELRTTLGLAAERQGKLAGLILIQRTPPDAEILTLAVSRAHRRMGLAAQLLRQAAELLGQYGIDRLLLDVAADNDGAVAFYRSAGFLADGRRKNYYQREGGSQTDAILMSRTVAGQIGESGA
ncbi:MAG: N-acetyltransferase [Henriciella sp.]|uniref:GNAT family N-acetyltransferase n=1 Tax=Henriciella sp. TaxID=1968823 RepID=UPI003C794A9D